MKKEFLYKWDTGKFLKGKMESKSSGIVEETEYNMRYTLEHLPFSDYYEAGEKGFFWDSKCTGMKFSGKLWEIHFIREI